MFPDLSGNVNVLSAVGSITVSVVSYISAVDPSKIIEESERARADIVGPIIVLFNKVSEPAAVTCGIVQAIPLVVDELAVKTVPLAPTGRVNVVPADVAVTRAPFAVQSDAGTPRTNESISDCKVYKACAIDGFLRFAGFVFDEARTLY